MVSPKLEHKIVIELSAQDRRRFDRMSKALEAYVKEHKYRVVVHNNRSAETGQFVTEDEARENPSTTVRET